MNFGKVIFRIILSFIFCLLIFFLPSLLHAEHLPIKTYTVAEGLLRDEIYKIRQDSHGFLWFCTEEGVSRFDGYGFKNFTAEDGLPSGAVNDFLETSDGTIYFATDKGLARLNSRGVRGSVENPLFTIILPDNLNAKKIRRLYEDKNKQILAGTSDGLYKLIYTNGTAQLVEIPLGKSLESSGGAIAEPNPNTLAVSSILEDQHGTLWIGTFGSGLFHISQEGKVRQFTAHADGFGDNKITDLLETKDGKLWMSLRSDEEGGVCLLNPEESDHIVKKCYTTKDGLSSNWVRAMLETSDGQMWLATAPGLCRWNEHSQTGNVCKTYTAKNGLCNSLLSLAEDKDGNLWTGSPCGAKKISRYGFTTYNAADGLNNDLSNNQITSIFENSAGELFTTVFPKTERIVSRFDGEKFSLAKLHLPKSVYYHGWGWKQTVWQDSHDAWWIPTGQGLFRTPDQTNFENLANAKLKKIETGAKGLEVFRLFEDSRSDIWILTTGKVNELLRWERARNIWHDYTAEAKFSTYRVGTAIAEDNFGNIWIGASSDYGQTALIRYRPKTGEFRILSEQDGAPSNLIGDLFIDSSGRLWIASAASGVWRLDDIDTDNFEFVKYNRSMGLSSDGATSITEDQFGRIYIGTWHGIDRLNPATGQIENFTTADGLPASFIEVAYRDKNNNLWFGTANGLTKFTPKPQRQRQPPIILITALRVEGEPQSVSVLGESEVPHLELNSDQHQISIDFVGLGASLGESLNYEYRLNNSADWTQITERTVNFANLATENYHFEIRAVTADRIYSLPAIVSFRIASPIWQRWWFLTLVFIVLTIFAYTFYRSRLKRLLEMERIRTRIATDLHDDIGANLTKISLMSEVAKQKSGNDSGILLTSIADIARESVASMNDIVWAIAPEHDSLLDLTRRMRQQAEEVFAVLETDLYFDAPASDTDLKLSIDVRRDLLLIFKEAVHNVSKHSACTKVWIDFRAETSVLTLRIKDNGRGFDSEKTNIDGHGLRSMTRRAKSLGGKLTITSHPKEGTIIEFILPLTKSGSA